MWDVTGNLIQVEISSDLANRYTPQRRFFGPGVQDGQLLLDEIENLRSRLQVEGIYVPPFHCRDNNDLPNGGFIVYVGSVFFQSNVQQNSISEVAEYLLRRMQTENVSKDGIYQEIQLANENLLQMKYRDALNHLNISYYWAHLINDCEEEAVDSILQIGRILTQNNDFEHAWLCAQRADCIASSPGFFNPYLRCASAEFAGFVCLLTGNFAGADNAYSFAAASIANVPGSSLLKIDILLADLQALIFQNNFIKANQVAQALLDVLEQSKCPNILPVYQLKSSLADCAIHQLKNAKDDLEIKYNDALKKLEIFEGCKGVLIAVSKFFIDGVMRAIPYLVGTLVNPPNNSNAFYQINFGINSTNKIQFVESR